MDLDTYIAHVRDGSTRLLDGYRADPTAPAWDGTGWDRAALLHHVASFQTWVRAQLDLGPGEALDYSSLTWPPKGEDLDAWFEQSTTDLAEKLGAMDVEASWPTWTGPQPGWFFPRRAAQEITVHRWDGVGGEVDAEIGVDGVTEHLTLFAPLMPAAALGGVAGTIHLHATDADGEWLVQLGPAGITFEHGHAKGDVAVRGEAGDLLLWIWNRAPVDDRFEVFGDPSLLDTWRTAVVL